MRGVRSTAVLLVLFLGLGAYIYFVELERPPASEADANEQMFAIEADDISALSIATPDARTEMERLDGVWRVTAPIDAAADETTVSSLTSSLASLEITRIVEEEAVDVAPFGLSDPAIEVAFRVADDGADGQQRLLIGDATPTGADRYAKLASADRVVLIANTVESTFNKSTFDLRDKTILRVASGEVDALAIASDGAPLRLAKQGNTWRLVEPWDVRADFSTVEGLVGRLGSGQMRAVVAEGDDIEDADLSEYGLEDPALAATVTAGSAAATLHVGGEALGGARYAMDASRPMVFTIDASLATDLARPAIDYRQKDLFTFRPFNATRIAIDRPDEATVVFERADAEPAGGAEPADATDPAWRRVQPEDGAVDPSLMDDLLASLSGLSAESFIESRPAVGLDEDDRVATVQVQFDRTAGAGTESTEERVVLWRTADDVYGVHGDEPGAALLSEQALDDAIAALEDVLQGRTDDAGGDLPAAHPPIEPAIEPPAGADSP